MKLKFKQQQYQTDATMAVIKCFEGQGKGYRKEVVSRSAIDQGLWGTEIKVDEIFSNKKLELAESDILKNVQALQKEQGLKDNNQLKGLNFTIEMETGTGKTYVYLRTIIELHEKYGFKKFVIVVQGLAIREGVDHSIKIMKQHFKNLYNNIYP